MNSFFYIIFGLVIGSLTGCFNQSKLDLRETYSSRDTKPFDTYVAKKIVEGSFSGKKIQLNKRTFSKMYAGSADTNAIYFCISRNLFVTEDDAQSMLDYVYQGNTLFLSASNIDTMLLSKLLCEELKADLLLDLMQLKYVTTKVNLSSEINMFKDSFNYYYKPFSNYFSSIKANYSRVIGYNDSKKPNCFILFWGKGRMILHCDPRAFSNYFLLYNNNYRYLQELLTLTDESPGTVYWDDYYRNQNVRRKSTGKFSTISELMKHPPLANAFWILIVLLGLYVLFNSKRKQRVIPVLKTNENSSIAFTQTIARLYLQHRDNKNIADKMITYFNEYIRKNYFLTANADNADFISALSRKSGVSFEQTKGLFNAIKEVNSKMELDDEHLLRLNEHIQQFYKKRI